MSILTRVFDKVLVRNIPKSTSYYSVKTEKQEGKRQYIIIYITNSTSWLLLIDEFRVLNLKTTKHQFQQKRKPFRSNVLPPR